MDIDIDISRAYFTYTPFLLLSISILSQTHLPTIYLLFNNLSHLLNSCCYYCFSSILLHLEHIYFTVIARERNPTTQPAFISIHQFKTITSLFSTDFQLILFNKCKVSVSVVVFPNLHTSYSYYSNIYNYIMNNTWLYILKYLYNHLRLFVNISVYINASK